MKRKLFNSLIVLAILLMTVSAVSAAPTKNQIGINVMLNTSVTNSIIEDLFKHGNVKTILPEINAIAMQAPASELDTIRGLPYVASASPDAVRNGSPIDTVLATNFLDGMNT